MNIEKQKNGYYRVRQYENGKRYSVNFDHEPSTKEIYTELAKKMALESSNMPLKGTLQYYSDKHLAKLEKDDIRDTTLRGYDSIVNNTPDWFLGTDIKNISEDICNKVLKEYEKGGKKGRSAKTVSSFWSYWHSVIVEVAPNLSLNVELPKKQKKKKLKYQPTTKDVKRILEYSKNTRYYIPLRMAVIGLRREELCAITAADIDKDNVLTIEKSLIVQRKTNKQIIVPYVKTEASYRRIGIEKDLADLIREQGYVFDGNMHTINENLHKIQKALDIPDFNLHILRHFAAAFLLKEGHTPFEIEEYMGWEHGSKVMEEVYAYVLDPDERHADIINSFSKLL